MSDKYSGDVRAARKCMQPGVWSSTAIYLSNRIMYVMFQLRPFTVHNVFPCFYGPNKVIIIIIITQNTFNSLFAIDTCR